MTFVIGSLLSGFSQNIEQLIAFRAVQGLGGGGLMALALAVIGDVIPPRERGRYQGYFAAVFGTSAVLGPVLGGFFADGPGWQWIFFMNVPIGLVALVVTRVALKMPHVRRDHTIDYLGAALVVGSVTLVPALHRVGRPGRGLGLRPGLGAAGRAACCSPSRSSSSSSAPRSRSCRCGCSATRSSLIATRSAS